MVSSVESDANDSTKPFLEDEKDVGCYKLDVIEGDKEGSKLLVLDEMKSIFYISTEQQKLRYFWSVPGEGRLIAPSKQQLLGKGYRIFRAD